MDDGKSRPMRGLALALWAFAGLNAADLALTVWGLAHGDTEGAPAASRVVARFGPLGLVALKGIIMGGTWALTWPVSRRYPVQLPRPLAWALGRLHELAGELGQPATMDVTAGADDAAEHAHLAAAGFALLNAHPLYLARDLTLLLPESSAPDGFIVRPLAGERELPAYTALYDATFTPIAPACRRALLADSDHTHFVAVEVGAGGAIAAFCECGVQPEEWEHLGARVGWVEYVGTAPAARGRGLGYAVTLAGLRWLRDRGCDTAMLVTGEGNATARRLYERLGFTVAAREDVWQVTAANGDAQ